MESVTYDLGMRKKRMHNTVKRRREIHNNEFYFFSFMERKSKEIVSKERSLSIFNNIKSFTSDRINDIESISSFIGSCLEFINGDNRGEMIESVRDMNIFIKDTIYCIFTKTMHSGDGSHRMIFLHFKKSRLNIRDSCFSVVELERNIFREIGRTVFTDITVIGNDKNDRDRAKGEMFKFDRSQTFRDMMVKGRTVRTDKRNDRRLKMNE